MKFGWKDDDKDRYRLPFVVVPLLCSLVVAIAPLPGNNYNWNGIFFCDIAGSPLGCDYPDTMTRCGEEVVPTEECVRGSEARDMLLYVGVIPYIVFFAIIIAAVCLLVYSVLKQERRMDRYQRDGALNRNMTKQTARQGMVSVHAPIVFCLKGFTPLLTLFELSLHTQYYIAAFGICWIPWYICEYLQLSCHAMMIVISISNTLLTLP